MLMDQGQLTKCVEYPGNSHIHVLLSSIAIRQGFRDSLALVVACPWANRVYMAPVVLPLGVFFRRAIYFYWEGCQMGGVNRDLGEGYSPDVLARSNRALTRLASPSIL